MSYLTTGKSIDTAPSHRRTSRSYSVADVSPPDLSASKVTSPPTSPSPNVEEKNAHRKLIRMTSAKNDLKAFYTTFKTEDDGTNSKLILYLNFFLRCERRTRGRPRCSFKFSKEETFLI